MGEETTGAVLFVAEDGKIGLDSSNVNSNSHEFVVCNDEKSAPKLYLVPKDASTIGHNTEMFAVVPGNGANWSVSNNQLVLAPATTSSCPTTAAAVLQNSTSDATNSLVTSTLATPLPPSGLTSLHPTVRPDVPVPSICRKPGPALPTMSTAATELQPKQTCSTTSNQVTASSKIVVTLHAPTIRSTPPTPTTVSPFPQVVMLMGPSNGTNWSVSRNKRVITPGTNPSPITATVLQNPTTGQVSSQVTNTLATSLAASGHTTLHPKVWSNVPVPSIISRNPAPALQTITTAQTALYQKPMHIPATAIVSNQHTQFPQVMTLVGPFNKGNWSVSKNDSVLAQSPSCTATATTGWQNLTSGVAHSNVTSTLASFLHVPAQDRIPLHTQVMPHGSLPSTQPFIFGNPAAALSTVIPAAPTFRPKQTSCTTRPRATAIYKTSAVSSAPTTLPTPPSTVVSNQSSPLPQPVRIVGPDYVPPPPPFLSPLRQTLRKKQPRPVVKKIPVYVNPTPTCVTIVSKASPLGFEQQEARPKTRIKEERNEEQPKTTPSHTTASSPDMPIIVSTFQISSSVFDLVKNETDDLQSIIDNGNSQCQKSRKTNETNLGQTTDNFPFKLLPGSKTETLEEIGHSTSITSSCKLKSAVKLVSSTRCSSTSAIQPTPQNKLEKDYQLNPLNTTAVKNNAPMLFAIVPKGAAHKTPAVFSQSITDIQQLNAISCLSPSFEANQPDPVPIKDVHDLIDTHIETESAPEVPVLVEDVHVIRDTQIENEPATEERPFPMVLFSRNAASQLKSFQPREESLKPTDDVSSEDVVISDLVSSSTSLKVHPPSIDSLSDTRTEITQRMRTSNAGERYSEGRTKGDKMRLKPGILRKRNPHIVQTPVSHAAMLTEATAISGVICNLSSVPCKRDGKTDMPQGNNSEESVSIPVTETNPLSQAAMLAETSSFRSAYRNTLSDELEGESETDTCDELEGESETDTCTPRDNQSKFTPDPIRKAFNQFKATILRRLVDKSNARKKMLPNNTSPGVVLHSLMTGQCETLNKQRTTPLEISPVKIPKSDSSALTLLSSVKSKAVWPNINTRSPSETAKSAGVVTASERNLEYVNAEEAVDHAYHCKRPSDSDCISISDSIHCKRLAYEKELADKQSNSETHTLSGSYYIRYAAKACRPCSVVLKWMPSLESGVDLTSADSRAYIDNCSMACRKRYLKSLQDVCDLSVSRPSIPTTEMITLGKSSITRIRCGSTALAAVSTNLRKKSLEKPGREPCKRRANGKCQSTSDHSPQTKTGEQNAPNHVIIPVYANWMTSATVGDAFNSKHTRNKTVPHKRPEVIVKKRSSTAYPILVCLPKGVTRNKEQFLSGPPKHAKAENASNLGQLSSVFDIPTSERNTNVEEYHTISTPTLFSGIQGIHVKTEPGETEPQGQSVENQQEVTIPIPKLAAVDSYIQRIEVKKEVGESDEQNSSVELAASSSIQHIHAKHIADTSENPGICTERKQEEIFPTSISLTAGSAVQSIKVKKEPCENVSVDQQQPFRTVAMPTSAADSCGQRMDVQKGTCESNKQCLSVEQHQAITMPTLVPFDSDTQLIEVKKEVVESEVRGVDQQQPLRTVATPTSAADSCGQRMDVKRDPCELNKQGLSVEHNQEINMPTLFAFDSVTHLVEVKKEVVEPEPQVRIVEQQQPLIPFPAPTSAAATSCVQRVEVQKGDYESKKHSISLEHQQASSVSPISTSIAANSGKGSSGVKKKAGKTSNQTKTKVTSSRSSRKRIRCGPETLAAISANLQRKLLDKACTLSIEVEMEPGESEMQSPSVQQPNKITLNMPVPVEIIAMKNRLLSKPKAGQSLVNSKQSQMAIVKKDHEAATAITNDTLQGEGTPEAKIRLCSDADMRRPSLGKGTLTLTDSVAAGPPLKVRCMKRLDDGKELAGKFDGSVSSLVSMAQDSEKPKGMSSNNIRKKQKVTGPQPNVLCMKRLDDGKELVRKIDGSVSSLESMAQDSEKPKDILPNKYKRKKQLEKGIKTSGKLGQTSVTPTKKLKGEVEKGTIECRSTSKEPVQKSNDSHSSLQTITSKPIHRNSTCSSSLIITGTKPGTKKSKALRVTKTLYSKECWLTKSERTSESGETYKLLGEIAKESGKSKIEFLKHKIRENFLNVTLNKLEEP